MERTHDSGFRRRMATTLAGASAAAVGAAVWLASGPSPAEGARVVASLPPTGRTETLALYGVTRSGKPFAALEGARVGEGWDVALFRAPGLEADQLALLVVCNEELVPGAAGAPDELARVCSEAWDCRQEGRCTDLPEPGSGALVAGAALLLALDRRRRE